MRIGREKWAFKLKITPRSRHTRCTDAHGKRCAACSTSPPPHQQPSVARLHVALHAASRLHVARLSSSLNSQVTCQKTFTSSVSAELLSPQVRAPRSRPHALLALCPVWRTHSAEPHTVVVPSSQVRCSWRQALCDPHARRNAHSRARVAGKWGQSFPSSDESRSFAGWYLSAD